MRQMLISLSTILLWSALATAQVTVNAGYATYWTPPPGMYAAPFVPLVTTPVVDLATPPLQVGASNVTVGNVAGATTSTLSLDMAGPSTMFALPAWYGQAVPSELGEKNSSTEARVAPTHQGFDLGVVSFQTDAGVARLLGEHRTRDHAQRVYTNDDIAHLDEGNGMVKFGGKTERID